MGVGQALPGSISGLKARKDCLWALRRTSCSKYAHKQRSTGDHQRQGSQ